MFVDSSTTHPSWINKYFLSTIQLALFIQCRRLQSVYRLQALHTSTFCLYEPSHEYVTVYFVCKSAKQCIFNLDGNIVGICSGKAAGNIAISLHVYHYSYEWNDSYTGYYSNSVLTVVEVYISQ